MSAGGQPRDTRASSRRGHDRRRHRSQRRADSDGTSSGGAVCPRCRSSGPLQLDVQPKPWHNRQDGLGVSEPEAVTRVRRFSPDPHPQPAQATRSFSSTRQRRGRGRWRAYGRTARAHSRLGISPRTRDSHTAHRHLPFFSSQDGSEDPPRAVQISTFLRGWRQPPENPIRLRASVTCSAPCAPSPPRDSLMLVSAPPCLRDVLYSVPSVPSVPSALRARLAPPHLRDI